ncbi:hypothetical protein AZC_0448 [Azorhizobium caulinodans ORS 571]|uniref:Transmembrane protein n=1 Tax=Azorhizobium caulinodans (strain ATCC 43989 / DSM 5975 / JCM 20966 / LMG 6465 / NBRC 14845 / NCIMB 13405 / ORS 571) TaxID=438753 RepID=A8ILY7_AZOC5|nr:hypothetical protein AZC_0448 [Azorhizobium caulinodans ORS 571]
MLVLLCTGLSVRRTQTRTAGFVLERLIAYILLFPVGLVGLWAALGHIVFAAQAAASIGWAPSPFQFEVGVANLGIGVAGLIGVWYRNWGYRLAVAVMTGGFLGGAAVGHVVQIVSTGNLAAGNAGPILYTDVLTPLSLLVLLALTVRSARS